MIVALIAYVGLGLLMAALAVPLLRRRVAPNALYGFRVPRTLADPGVWYEANAKAGAYLLGAGVAIGVACLALFLAPGLDLASYLAACGTVAVIAVAVAVGLSFRTLGRIPAEAED